MRASLGTDKLRCCDEFPTQGHAWEADTRDGRSEVESLNRWEKTIGLYSDSERSGHLRWYPGCCGTGTVE